MKRDIKFSHPVTKRNASKMPEPRLAVDPKLSAGLAKILAFPDDDQARYAYAELLSPEDPRRSFIQAQLTMARKRTPT